MAFLGVFRLVASCGCVLPLTVIVASLIPNEPVSTRSPAMTTVPVTAFVRPTTSLLIHALAFLEPDPAAEWDAGRIAAVREALSSLSLPE